MTFWDILFFPLTLCVWCMQGIVWCVEHPWIGVPILVVLFVLACMGHEPKKPSGVIIFFD
jgi:hypothetical protein